MRTLQSVAAWMMLGACSMAVAQEQSKSTDRREVITSGEAVIYVVPDEVTLSFGVRGQDGDLDKAVAEAEQRAKTLLAAIRAAGVPEEQIATTRMEVWPQSEWNGVLSVVKSYVAGRTYTLTLKKIDGLEQIIRAALKSGATEMGSVEFKSSASRAKRDEARVQACKAAREKAELLATALGAKVGRAVKIVEEETPTWPQPQLRMANAMSQEVGPGGEQTSVPPGQIAMRGRVSVTFELE